MCIRLSYGDSQDNTSHLIVLCLQSKSWQQFLNKPNANNDNYEQVYIKSMKRSVSLIKLIKNYLKLQ